MCRRMQGHVDSSCIRERKRARASKRASERARERERERERERGREGGRETLSAHALELFEACSVMSDARCSHSPR